MTANIPQTAATPDWLDRANAATLKLEEGMIRMAVIIGRELLAGKAACKHGEFLDWIAARYCKSVDVAERFMGIAENSVFSNPVCIPYLPTSVHAAAQIAQMPAEILEPIVLRGKEITRDMTDQQASVWLRKWKIREKARQEAEKRKRKGLPPKPSPLTGDAAKLHKAQLAQERSDRRAAIAEIPQEEIDLLGPIAAHEKDLAEYARFTDDFKAKVIVAVKAGANRLPGAIKLAETLGEGRQLTGRDGERVDWRITPAMVRLPDILEPVLSLLGKTVTAMRRAQAQIAEIPACDKVTLGRVPELLARVEQLDELKRSLGWQVPAVVCERCKGKAQQPPCPDCRGCGWWDRATAAKRKADREATDELRGRA